MPSRRWSLSVRLSRIHTFRVAGCTQGDLATPLLAASPTWKINMNAPNSHAHRANRDRTLGCPYRQPHPGRRRPALHAMATLYLPRHKCFVPCTPRHPTPLLREDEPGHRPSASSPGAISFPPESALVMTMSDSPSGSCQTSLTHTPLNTYVYTHVHNEDTAVHTRAHVSTPSAQNPLCAHGLPSHPSLAKCCGLSPLRSRAASWALPHALGAAFAHWASTREERP